MSLLLLSSPIAILKLPDLPSKAELECLATNVYREARGESREGQVAVASVTLNRVKMKEYPNTICGVVYMPYQFSWTSKYRDIKYDFPAITAAVEAISNDSFKATHYHNQSVKPSWRKQLKQGVTIGNHTFYYP